MSRFRAEADMADHRMMNKLPAMIAAIRPIFRGYLSDGEHGLEGW
jgi:hypothetical protein